MEKYISNIAITRYNGLALFMFIYIATIIKLDFRLVGGLAWHIKILLLQGICLKPL